MQQLRTSRIFGGWRIIVMLLIGAGNSSAGTMPDYTLFDEVLLENVHHGFVDYDGFKSNPRFDEFLRQIGDTPADSLADADQRLAFYINAYNALAIKGILEGRSLGGRRARRSFFSRTTHRVLGQDITLETLQQNRLMTFGDARIHFAITCAAISCPRLSNRAYQPDSIDFQLHDAARNFINDPTRNRFDDERSSAVVSMLFKWHDQDFASAGGSVQRYLARFADDAQIADSLRAEQFDLLFEEHDWSLNGHITRAAQ